MTWFDCPHCGRRLPNKITLEPTKDRLISKIKEGDIIPHSLYKGDWYCDSCIEKIKASETEV